MDAAAGDFVYIPAGEVHVEENASGDRATGRRPDAQLPGFAGRVRRRRTRRERRRPRSVLTRWGDRSFRDLLASVGLDDAAEEPFPNDGWSGSVFSRLHRADGAAFVLKRTSARIDWIVRETHDEGLREAGPR